AAEPGGTTLPNPLFCATRGAVPRGIDPRNTPRDGVVPPAVRFLTRQAHELLNHHSLTAVRHQASVCEPPSGGSRTKECQGHPRQDVPLRLPAPCAPGRRPPCSITKLTGRNYFGENAIPGVAVRAAAALNLVLLCPRPD